LDGLLENDTILRPREHTSDTHGYTEHIFALCYLLGFTFMPRIRDIKDQRLYKCDKSKRCTHCEPLFSGSIELDLIREQWDQLVRVAASLRNRTAPAHVIVERLANGSDRLSKALKELGRLVKTIFVLRYLDDDKLRGKVQLQLNRGEGRHGLAKHLFFANQGEFKTRDYPEIMNKASCLSLLSNAVLLWNTIQMQKIIENLEGQGHKIAGEDIARVSPLMFRHVNPTGVYSFQHIAERRQTAL
jgi:TnpA family transposase